MIDDAVMALPEGLMLCWFDASRLNLAPNALHVFSERMQIALAQSEAHISSELPDPFRFVAAERTPAPAHWLLKLERNIESDRLSHALQEFSACASLEICPPPALYETETPNGIALGSAGENFALQPISFKKYELVIYIAELPKTPLSGFQFRAIARIHHKSVRGRRRSQNM